MNPKLIFLLFVVLAVIFEIFADILFKLSHVNGRPALLWAGVGLYTIGTIIWAYSLRFEYFSKAISLFTILNLIAIILVGFLFFKEDLSFVNKIGIGLGVISVVLMQI